MRVTDHSPCRARRARLRSIAPVGLALTVIWTVVAGHPVRADETVRFDGGGAEVSLIGDSTLAGVRWYADYGELRRFDLVLNAESCRRTVEQSCISREGYRSATVVQTVRSLADELGEVLVVMTGYNDPVWSIDEAISSVLDGARDAGVDHVVWLTLRTSDDVDYSDPQEQSSVETFREYNEQLVATAEASEGFLQVADWATYSTGASDWFEYDGVHLTSRGVDALTGFLATTIDRVLAGEDVSPAAAPWVVLVPGAEGPEVEAVQRALIDAGVDVPGGVDGVYGDDTMVAVATYQRNDSSLQVTGAVDAATARSLGLHDDTATAVADAAPATTAPLDREPSALSDPTTIDGPMATSISAPGASSDASASNGGERTQTIVVTIVVAIALLAAAVVARGRYVAARRKRRRWARVHPATSPLRSVADDRRADTGMTDDTDAMDDVGRQLASADIADTADV